MTDQSTRDAIFAAILKELGMTGSMAERATDAAMLALGGKPVTQDADAKAYIAAGMKAASAMLCLPAQDIRLACGEMTAQEMRTVNAVLEWRRAAIVRKAEGL